MNRGNDRRRLVGCLESEEREREQLISIWKGEKKEIT